MRKYKVQVCVSINKAYVFDTIETDAEPSYEDDSAFASAVWDKMQGHPFMKFIGKNSKQYEVDVEETVIYDIKETDNA